MTVAVGAVLGALVGLGLHWWMRREGYRYDDERHRPSRSSAWLVPVLAGAGAALAWRADGEVAVLVTYGVAFAWMAGLAVIDVDVRRLPDRWTLPSYPVWVALLAWCSWATGGGWTAWVTALVCGAVSGAVYLLLVLGNPAGLGLGDVKLAVPLGMLAGWFGWPAAFLAFVGAFLLGLVVGVVAAIRTGKGRKATFPFGPSMLAAAALVVLLLAPTASRA